MEKVCFLTAAGLGALRSEVSSEGTCKTVETTERAEKRKNLLNDIGSKTFTIL